MCDNHRGISLLSIAGKILARLILNRIIKHLVDDIYPESQCGFRSGRGTIDMIFSLHQVAEKVSEKNQEMYMVFVDLTKAFDTVNREALWQVLKKLGIPENMLNVIISFTRAWRSMLSLMGWRQNRSMLQMAPNKDVLRLQSCLHSSSRWCWNTTSLI